MRTCHLAIGLTALVLLVGCPPGDDDDTADDDVTGNDDTGDNDDDGLVDEGCDDLDGDCFTQNDGDCDGVVD